MVSRQHWDYIFIPFEILIPKGYKLVSPMYKINASERLLEAVTITIKHNAVVTNSEMAEALALLHISDEGEIKLLYGRVEPNNSTYVSPVISDLCYIAVIGLNKLNQTFLVSFFRKKNDHGYSNPLLTVAIVIYPFKQNKVSFLRIFIFANSKFRILRKN